MGKSRKRNRLHRTRNVPVQFRGGVLSTAVPSPNKSWTPDRCPEIARRSSLDAVVLQTCLRTNVRIQRVRAVDSAQVKTADRALRCNPLFVHSSIIQRSNQLRDLTRRLERVSVQLVQICDCCFETNTQCRNVNKSPRRCALVGIGHLGKSDEVFERTRANTRFRVREISHLVCFRMSRNWISRQCFCVVVRRESYRLSRRE